MKLIDTLFGVKPKLKITIKKVSKQPPPDMERERDILARQSELGILPNEQIQQRLKNLEPHFKRRT